MKTTYLCPYCHAAINACDYIVLAAKFKQHVTGIVLLHEEIGNYTSHHSASLEIKEGDVVDLFCPVCSANLETYRGDQFASYIRKDESGNESRIIISRKYGEKVTFKVEEGKPHESYGDRVKKYMDPDWYLGDM